MPATPSVDLVGQTIASQFSVERKLGAGGMGAVYLAEQIGMDRKVVLKVMHPELTAGSLKAVERFKREAKAVARLNHPNIVQIFVFGQTDSGQMYIAMEFIEGRSLTSELGHRPMPQGRALRILDQICAALIEAHGHGIVHRDLKPDNIMLSDRHGNADYVKVLDFGIAKMADSSQATLTQDGAVFGTPRYMAPEQAQGGEVDVRADVYAVGLILYEMLTGEHPFPNATTALEYIVKHATAEVPAPHLAVDGLVVSPRVETIVARCVAKDPADRYQSARELQREVRLALRDLPEAARAFPTGDGTLPVSAPAAPVAAPAPAAPADSKKGLAALTWVVAGLLLAGGVAGALAMDRTSTPLPATAGDVQRGRAVTKASPEADEGRVAREGEAKATLKPSIPPKAPTTDVAEGVPIEGFPVPASARITTSTPQVEVLQTDLSADQLVGFYKAKLAGKYGEIQDVPNGLMIKGDTPFNVVTISAAGGGRMSLVLARNAFYKRAPTSPGGGDNPTSYLGVTLPQDSAVIIKTDQGLTLRSRAPMREVCDDLAGQLSGLDKVLSTRFEDASGDPGCAFASTQADTRWSTVSVVQDPTIKGSLVVHVQAK
ncbi:MAG: hypothetical protein CSA66_01235 [Proteobacteria bacterium]|nr:MAG: hypothetical protein CSA66_01235 [Pseudomonadota bacterium]